tara:strand:- start:31 stop:288 length:258 start_codon:yes stop_codon:yes gene_type:complete
MATKKETQEIVVKFSRFIKHGDPAIIDDIKLSDLKKADIDLAWRDINSSYRIAIQNKIKELEQSNRLRLDKKQHDKALLISILAL